jgi:hypothetical protein
MTQKKELTEDQLAAVRQLVRLEAIETIFEAPWILLYRFRDEEAWYSGLLGAEEVPNALSDISWEIGVDDYRPCIVRNGTTGDLTYKRFPRNGTEPLVLVRHKGNAFPLIELSEELRLFLNLFPHSDGNLYRSTEGGDLEIVVKVTSDEVMILKAPLRRYLSVRQKHLAIYFDHISWFPEIQINPLPESERSVEIAEADRRWNFGTMDDDGELCSRLCGKRLLAPEALVAEAVGGSRRCVEFIIGYDDKGHQVEHSADSAALADFFGKNAGAPNYLTPVHFRRDVLDRYFHNPGRFTVSDGSLRHGSDWVLSMDDDHVDRVIVFLGDLGRDLPYTEQLQWRAHNIPPDGPLSVTAKARSFDARFADGEQPEHRFKVAYHKLAKEWTARHGWQLFRPLAPADGHLLTKLHVPTGDNPAELDSQILGLAKILVDSLNDPALDAALASPIKDERSLSKLERFLNSLCYPDTMRDVAALRSIQSLRSAGVAHTRGSTYDKSLEKLGLIGQSAQTIVNRLLSDAITMLESLTAFARV